MPTRVEPSAIVPPEFVRANIEDLDEELHKQAREDGPHERRTFTPGEIAVVWVQLPDRSEGHIRDLHKYWTEKWVVGSVARDGELHRELVNLLKNGGKFRRLPMLFDGESGRLRIRDGKHRLLAAYEVAAAIDVLWGRSPRFG
jgi:hypothetical protein